MVPVSWDHWLKTLLGTGLETAGLGNSKIKSRTLAGIWGLGGGGGTLAPAKPSQKLYVPMAPLTHLGRNARMAVVRNFAVPLSHLPCHPFTPETCIVWLQCARHGARHQLQGQPSYTRSLLSGSLSCMELEFWDSQRLSTQGGSLLGPQWHQGRGAHCLGVGGTRPAHPQQY